MTTSTVRMIGLVRAKDRLAMQNLACTMRRLVPSNKVTPKLLLLFPDATDTCGHENNQ